MSAWSAAFCRSMVLDAQPLEDEAGYGRLLIRLEGRGTFPQSPRPSIYTGLPNPCPFFLCCADGEKRRAWRKADQAEKAGKASGVDRPKFRFCDGPAFCMDIPFLEHVVQRPNAGRTFSAAPMQHRFRRKTTILGGMDLWRDVSKVIRSGTSPCHQREFSCQSRISPELRPGIGQATAERFIEEGWTVVCDINSPPRGTFAGCKTRIPAACCFKRGC